ncbi:MAG: hypothetical protein AAF958_04410 [Planctomycetota bacterium]
MQRPQNHWMIVAVTCVSLCGCVTTGKPNADPSKRFFDDWPLVGNKDADPAPYPKPAKMAATWTPDSLIRSGHTPTRGFGGRLYFYDEKSKPVPVEGTLIVHGFDDTDDSGDQQSRRFEFTPEQFTRHFSQSDLGASYSVWIPWDAVGGNQKRISLVASFRTKAGHAIQGVPATVLLPGPTPKRDEDDIAARWSPEYRKYRDAFDTGKSRANMLTTTIGGKRSPNALLDPIGAAEAVASKTDDIAADLPLAPESGSTKVIDFRRAGTVRPAGLMSSSSATNQRTRTPPNFGKGVNTATSGP